MPRPSRVMAVSRQDHVSTLVSHCDASSHARDTPRAADATFVCCLFRFLPTMDFTEVYKQTAGLVLFSPGTTWLLTAVHDRLVVRRSDSFEITRTWQLGAQDPSSSQLGKSETAAANKPAATAGAVGCMITHAGWSSDSEFLFAASAKNGFVEVFKLMDEAWNARIECGAEGLVKVEWAPDGRSILCFSEWGVSSQLCSFSGY